MDIVKTYPLAQRLPELKEELLELWAESVEQTHHFLEHEDIQTLKPAVLAALGEIPVLAAAFDKEEQINGFIGVQNRKVEMLFLRPRAIGLGLGRLLLTWAVQTTEAYLVDVNEQNHSALAFYLKMGFEIFSRSEADSQNNPFPLLHLKLIGS
ncbi:MAG: GNAT family N-acetyltransferase [Deltaproteobacteria bacterium]|jgi:putative acetyltransferase|nr:GNAT family N-acetyltransferase [Deltaproteobacteria bacterium]